MTEAEEYASAMIATGFRDQDEVVEAVHESFEDELSEEEAEELVDRLWQARLAEEADWPAETAADRLLAAFSALDGEGIVARADFTCCNTCGTTEIGAEVDGPARGYVFFHNQDTERAAEGGGLYLSYGTFDGTDPVPVAETVVAALRAADLPAEWDGDVRARILVSPLEWQLRLAAQP
jgi:hypothetical protein